MHFMKLLNPVTLQQILMLDSTLILPVLAALVRKRQFMSRTLQHQNWKAAASSSAKSPYGGEKEPSMPIFFSTLSYTEILSCTGMVAYAAWHVIKETINITKSDRDIYPSISHLLRPGWIPGRLIDLSDQQYHSFRSGIPGLAALFTVFALINRLTKRSHWMATISTALFVVALHGSRSIDVFLLVTLNYLIIRLLPKNDTSKAFVIHFTWSMALALLVVLDGLNRHSEWTLIKDEWLPFRLPAALPRWSVIFKISLLRIISYNFDQSNAIASEHRVEVCEKCQDTVCLEYRMNAHLHTNATNSFCWMLRYIFYPPLYVSGPIMTFNDYVFQQQQLRRSTVPWRSPALKPIAVYALRWLACFLVLEVILHFLYVNAIKSASAWSPSMTPISYAGVAFFNLKTVWLKLLIIWRFARFFAMVDGIECPENLLRCMSNNYSTQGFWRSWHRSFNIWIRRYLYIPLGGSRKHNLRNIFVVFAFVAIWHDLDWHVLLWGLLIPIFLLPELLFAPVFYRLLVRLNRAVNYSIIVASPSRALCAIGASFNILLMMLANLVGFGVGIDGARILLQKLLLDQTASLKFMGGCGIVLFAASQLMFTVRDLENDNPKSGNK